MKFRQTRFWKHYSDYIKISGDSSTRGFVDGLLFWKLLTTYSTHRHILEIGCLQGLTTGLLFDCLPTATVLSVDIVDHMDLFRINHADRAGQHQLIIMDSQLLCLDDQYDIVFIDGDHAYGPCLSDIKFGLDHLDPQGLLIIDDYMMDGVAAAINDFYALTNDWVPFLQGIQTQFWHHRSQDKSNFLDQLLTDPVSNFILLNNIQDCKNNTILEAKCVRMLTDHYKIFDSALEMYDI